MILGIVAGLYFVGLGLVWRATRRRTGVRRLLWLAAFTLGYAVVACSAVVASAVLWLMP